MYISDLLDVLTSNTSVSLWSQNINDYLIKDASIDDVKDYLFNEGLNLRLLSVECEKAENIIINVEED